VLEKQRTLRDVARQTRVKLRMHDSEGSWLEGVLARGDRSLCDAIERAYRNGARFDCWEEKLRLDLWVEAFQHHGVDAARFLGTIPTSARLPWDHIDVGLEPGFLAKEYRKALKNRLSPPCGKAVGNAVHHTNVEEHDADAKKFVCYNCGIACDLGEMRSDRRDFLVKLRALKKKAPKLEPVVVAVGGENTGSGLGSGESEVGEQQLASPGDKRPGVKKRQPTAQFDQGKPMRVRIAYQKVGRAAFRGHLDLVRLLPRMFRRLDLPMYYSQGFHPKPEMTFGPALPLGVASQAEYVDVKLIEAPGLDEAVIRERLLGASLEGVVFTDAVVLGPQDAGIGKVINTARYVIGLPVAALEAIGAADVAALKLHVAGRLTGTLKVVRDAKGIKRTVDVGQYLRDVKVGEGADELIRAGIGGELIPLTFTLKMTGQGGARPTEVLEVLLGDPEIPARFVRVFMGREDLPPLALNQLRARMDASPEEVATQAPDEADTIAAGFGSRADPRALTGE
jgi:radical SAM-linked protein